MKRTVQTRRRIHGYHLAGCVAALGLWACGPEASSAQCGNGVIEAGEVCDGTALGVHTCQSELPGATGTLTCMADCTLDTSGCTVCGNGVREAGEACDGAALGERTCQSEMPGSTGTLSCLTDCTLDTSGCAICGNGVREAGEACDGGVPGERTCESEVPGSTGGLSCTKGCTLDTSGCAICGNGVRETGEGCDCGGEPSKLPLGCSEVNGGSESTCDNHCEATCCVVISGLGPTEVSFCEGPDTSLKGTPASTPIIWRNGSALRLQAGAAREENRRNALQISMRNAAGAGDFSNPLLEYWNEKGEWHENNAMTGTLHVDNWSQVGTRITGTFSGMVANMVTFESHDISGTYCAMRGADVE